MVVMRSPKPQRAGSASAQASAASTSPLRLLGGPASDTAALDQRIAESLQLVAASPSKKENAPWPFADSGKMRRSPPSRLRQPAPSLLLPSAPIASTSIFDEPNPSIDFPNLMHDESLPVASTSANKTAADGEKRNFDIAAIALFGGDAGRRLKARHSTPSGLKSNTALQMLSAGSHTGAKRRVSQADLDFQRSVAILATPLRDQPAGSRESATQVTVNGHTSPQSVQTLARIGRLTASLAQLEAETATAKSEVDALQAKYTALQEQYEQDADEKALLQTRLVEYEGLVDQCKDVLDEHEQLKASAEEANEKLASTEHELAESRDLHTKIKYREKKLRGELKIRRLEGKWQDVTEQHREFKALQLELLGVKADHDDLEAQLQIMASDRDYHAFMSTTLRKELDQLLKLQKDSASAAGASQEALAKQAVASRQERSELSQKLEEANKARVQAEQEKHQLAEQLLTHKEDTAARKDQAKEVKTLQARVKALEKEVKDLRAERDDALKEHEELQASLKEEKKIATKAKSKVARLEKERLLDARSKATGAEARSSSSSPAQRVSASPARETSKPTAKRKRTDRQADSPPAVASDDEAHEEPVNKAKKARTTANIVKASTALEPVSSDAEEVEAALEVVPPPKKRGRPPKAKPVEPAAASTGKKAGKKAAKKADKPKEPSPIEEMSAEERPASDEEVEEELVKKKLPVKTPAAKPKATVTAKSKADSSKSLSAGSKTTITATGKTKLGGKSIFTWGGMTTSGGSKSTLLGLPDVLSPVKRS